MEYHALSKMLKLVCALVIWDAPIHDVAAREKHLIGSEHAFCAFYLILDRVPKYSTKQQLPLYNPFKLTTRRDQSQLIDILVIRLRVEYFLFGDRHVRARMLPQLSFAVLEMPEFRFQPIALATKSCIRSCFLV